MKRSTIVERFIENEIESTNIYRTFRDYL